MFKKLQTLIIALIFFSSPIFGEDSESCSYDGLKKEDFEKMEKILVKYVDKSVDLFIRRQQASLDANIPHTTYISFADGGAFIDAIFGLEMSGQKGFVFSSTRLPYEFSTIGLGFRKKDNQCYVYIVEAGSSGIVYLYLRGEVPFGYNSLNLARDNNPTFYTFPISKIK